jgi:hypothetical protein
MEMRVICFQTLATVGCQDLQRVACISGSVTKYYSVKIPLLYKAPHREHDF